MALWWKRTENAHRLSMAELEKENEQLKQQVTDAQLALAELYEMMTPGG